MMNRRDSEPSLAHQGFQFRRFLAILAGLWVIALFSSARAQMTLDGTNCVIFAGISQGELVRCVARRPDGSTLTISLIGKPPNSVNKIELSIDGLTPFQTIDITAEPTIDHQNIGLLITDMNFDKLPDFAVMEFAAAGPNTPYLYFLYTAESGKFDASPALSKITAPSFDAKSGTITSHWRDGAARNGLDRYVWRDGEPALIGRVERNHDGSGCRLNTYDEKNGKLALTKSAACAD